MRARFDFDDYLAASSAQRAQVDAFLDTIARPITVYAIRSVDATGEGTVRIERYLGRYDQRMRWEWEHCPACGRMGEPVLVRETIRTQSPPPWLTWTRP